ncbi:LysR family transcriptional regulator [Castellaniella sp.]|uniref:LysR family transcriptional regulator n=1 Tax=Castellaniella sp. TaxID=1955812 RepID=UPI002AFDFB89|nr:LysR substrate-binding domain-containing protein [Castellaniella sp.]
MNISTRQLRAFVAAAKYGHFTRAAKELCLSQPAFSALVKTLENDLGAQLFARSTRKVELTPFGRLFETFAQQSLLETDTALRNLQDYAAGRVGRVHVAALPSIAANWLPTVFAQFRKAFPAVTIGLKDRMSEECITLLADGEIDLALATVSHYSSELEREQLWQDGFHLVCPKDHPLAAQPEPVTLDDVAAYPLVNFVRFSSVRQCLDAGFGERRVNTVLELEHLATVSAMVERGLGVSLVPTLTLYQFNSPALAVRPVFDQALSRNIYILRHKNRRLTLPAQALYDLVMKHVRALNIASSREGAGIR